ncbi:MAG: hypothetical protein HUU20_01465 [Pirellulales bacterium]|nr:hypothetical protein [Pirellulales bacterium]
MANAGYELLAAAGAARTGTTIFELETEPSDGEIAEFLIANKEVLEGARHALQKRCAVSLEYHAAFFQEHCEGFPALRNLARSFALEIEAADRFGDLPGAVAVGLDVFALANATRRGGLIVDLFVALGIEGIAINRMRGIRRQLNPHHATHLANELLRTEAEREPFDHVYTRDQEWEKAVGWSDGSTDSADFAWPESGEIGIDEETRQVITAAVQSYAALPDREKRAFQKPLDDRNLALMRLLALECALNSFHARHGRYPYVVSELVPDNIAAVPRDPFTTAEFHYRTTPAGCVVYSPGPTGQDAGGKFGSWLSVMSGDADLSVDMFDYDDAC